MGEGGGEGGKECVVWLQGKGKLRKKDQQYGEWLRVDPVRHIQISVAVISGASRSQAPCWRKQNGPMKKPSNQAGYTTPIQPYNENGSESATAMESDENLVDVDSSNVRQPLMYSTNQFDLNHDSNRQRTANPRGEQEHARGLEAEVVSLKIVDGVVNSPRKDSFRPHSTPLTNITNRGNLDSTLFPITKKWKRVEHEAEPTITATSDVLGDHRLTLDLIDLSGNKKQRLVFCSSDNKENFAVVVGFQHHRSS